MKVNLRSVEFTGAPAWSARMDRPLAAVAVLGVVLVLVVVLVLAPVLGIVLVVILILVSVLVIHGISSDFFLAALPLSQYAPKLRLYPSV